MFEDYVKNYRWILKEDLSSYLKMDRVKLKSFLYSIKLSDEEKSRYHYLRNNLLDIKDKAEFLSVMPEFKPFIKNGLICSKWNELNNEPYGKNLNNPYLDDIELSFYKEKGVIGPYQLGSSSEKKLIRIQKNIQTIQKNGHVIISGLKNINILELAMDPEILAKISSILGDNIVLLNSILRIIPENSHKEKKFIITHSDINIVAGSLSPDFFDEKDKGFVTVWISISGTNEELAPLHFFPTTQKWGIIPISSYLKHVAQNPHLIEYYSRALSLIGNNQFYGISGLNYDIISSTFSVNALSNIKKVSILTNPGEYIIFNGHILHGSSINRSNKPRIAISFRYRNAMEKPIVSLNYGLSKEHFRKFYSPDELKQIGMPEACTDFIALQLLGSKHHVDYTPINIPKLLKIMKEKNFTNELL